MIEIIVVLIVIAILGTTAMISGVYSTSDYDLASQTEILESHLRYAQARAMNTDVVWGIDFFSTTSTTSTTTYSLFKNGNTGVKVVLPAETSDSVTLPDGMTIPVGIVSFDSWGKPYIDASAQTQQNEGTGWREITLKGDTETTIRVTNNTGFIYIP